MPLMPKKPSQNDPEIAPAGDPGHSGHCSPFDPRPGLEHRPASPNLPLPPELLLIIMQNHSFNHACKSLLEFALASRSCHALGAPLLQKIPRCTVFVPIVTVDLSNSTCEAALNFDAGDNVPRVFREKAGAEKYLRRLDLVSSDRSSVSEDCQSECSIETEDSSKDHNGPSTDPDCIISVEKCCVIGDLDPANHVWLRFCNITDGQGGTWRKFAGVFATEEEANRGRDRGCCNEEICRFMEAEHEVLEFELLD